MSAVSQSASSRSRNQTRKKPNEDASYVGPAISTTAGVKRQAGALEGESSRAKRKKIEPIPVVQNKFPESENRISMVDFAKMPSQSIHRYLATFDLIPHIRPLPSSADEPPPPYSLGSNQQYPPRPPSPVPSAPTPANRPRRDQNPKDQSRRRSSRLSEDVPSFERTPILADVHDLHLVLAGLAEKHFREMGPINGREEVDILAAFMFAVEPPRGGKPK